jgi:hypothetical protein
MKKILALLLCAALLTACGSTSKTESAAESTPDTSESASEAAESTAAQSDAESDESSEELVGIPNPMIEYDSAVFPGYELANYPNDEDLAPEKYWLIGDNLIQLDYMVELNSLTFRAEKGGEEDISGVYETFEEDAVQDMTLADGTVVSVHYRATAAGPALATWVRDGWSYSLYMEHSPMGTLGGLLPRFLEAYGISTVATK